MPAVQLSYSVEVGSSTSVPNRRATTIPPDVRGTAVMLQEPELVAKLHALVQEYEQVNRKMTLAAQMRRFGTDPGEAARAETEEQQCLREMNRLMDRMRAVESGLGRARKGLMPVVH
jgi:hypothetical protein